MFRFVTNGIRNQKDIAVGDTVMCIYADRWQGTVLELHKKGGLAVVQQHTDHQGNPMPSEIVKYHCHWFRKVA